MIKEINQIDKIEKDKITQAMQAMQAQLQKDAGRIVLLGHDCADADSILSCMLLKRFLAARGIKNDIVIGRVGGLERDTEKMLGALSIALPQDMCEQTQDDDWLILADHHSTRHAGRVLCAIDHHPASEQNLPYPVWISSSASACGLLLWRLFDKIGGATEYDAWLAVCSAYLDTFSFGSTKTNPDDIALCAKLCEIYGFDADLIARAGLCLDDPRAPIERLADGGMKRYRVEDMQITATYVKTDCPSQIPIAAILAHLQSRREREGCALWIYAVTDPIHRTTALYWLDARGIREEHYTHIVSRTKEIQPRIAKMLLT